MMLIKAILDRLSYINMAITILGGFDPTKCLTECVDAFSDLFCKNKISEWLSVGTSPNIGLYHMNKLPNTKETSAKISVLVTIFVRVPLILAKVVRSDPSKLFIIFGMSPRIGLYRLKLVFDCKEASAKISVPVTIFE